MNRKPSFFSKLASAIRMNSSPKDADYYDEEILEDTDYEEREDSFAEEDIAGELAVDVYESRDIYYVVAVTAGVRKGDFDISLTRDILTITGNRSYSPKIPDGDYLFQELYWGTFTRTIALPEEVDIEKAEAKEELGLLTIKLPKMDPNRETRLKVT
ncbi:MAG: HSP20 family protein [Planctomycetota bacterium]|jgi:HSP20 family protein